MLDKEMERMASGQRYFTLSYHTVLPCMCVSVCVLMLVLMHDCVQPEAGLAEQPSTMLNVSHWSSLQCCLGSFFHAPLSMTVHNANNKKGHFIAVLNKCRHV